MKKVLIFILALTTTQAFAKKNFEKQNKEILEEGIRLYKSEKASWHGTDIFMERYKDKEKIGGYFSYVEDNIAKCIFFSKEDQPKVLGTIAFDSTYNIYTAEVDLKERVFTPLETSIYMIRQSTKKILKENKDGFFRSYKNTNYNIIPLIHNNEKKVYIITGSTQNGVTFLGNDYLLTFDKNNNLKKKTRLHQSLIPFEYEKASEGKEAMHTHLPETGPLFTPTDICTLMLYAPFAGWKQHIVYTKDYMSFWVSSGPKIATVSNKVIKKINKKSNNQ